jgi:hypothetical protein
MPEPSAQKHIGSNLERRADDERCRKDDMLHPLLPWMVQPPGRLRVRLVMPSPAVCAAGVTTATTYDCRVGPSSTSPTLSLRA